ncbi:MULTISPECIES: DUF4153 domain-containing protein [unclassified Pseudocitrobacter]|uniref:DUF4153 domain-containing protein n=1 Tax=unclassified Pseudocitrobacter TaxID=2638778 RepID=UPI0023E361C8|nr:MULTISPECIES: DUF4153 domain-containing protein [unclassified Pseudocitrobacter]MDF3826600.1 DUF4153 domain-containing protein [Pseudocitrobacter sp. 2023EL-00150]MEC5372757.1 DUF4153 domain-containing protein [Pseudocitrobacter sp. MW920760]
MDNVELSRPTRWGMVATGLIQGLLCYLLITWLAPKNSGWLFYGVPATVALSSTLLFTVISFRQKRLWGWLALVFVAVLGMSGWMKWQTGGVAGWRADNLLWDYGCYLLLMTMLLLPWIQQNLNPRQGVTRYARFYGLAWHNALTLLVIFIANGLTWLVLLLWSELFKIVGITFFKTLFFETDWFIYLTLGLITALAVILARTQPRLIGAVQKLMTIIATGLLPPVALLTLLFIVTLPFTGLSAISDHASAAGVLSTLAFLLLLLMAIVRDPQKTSLPYVGVLRCLIKTALLIAPVYVLISAWALWLRVNQYGWTPDRIHGVLMVMVLLVWSLGYFISIVRQKGRNPLVVQGKVNLAVSLLGLLFVALLNTPVLDSWRISVNSHMARYHSGKISADQVTVYLLYSTGRYGREAMESLKNDAEYMKDAERKRELLTMLGGDRDQFFMKDLADNVAIAPGTSQPDEAFWRMVMDDRGRLSLCIVKDACLLVSQDLNDDGQPERILFIFGDKWSPIYTYDPTKKTWDSNGTLKLPKSITKEQVLRAMSEERIGTKLKSWRDVTIDGETLEAYYNN